MTNFKVGDYVIATAAASKRYKSTTEGFIGVVVKAPYKSKEKNGENTVDVKALGGTPPFMPDTFDLAVSCLKRIESPAEYFFKSGMTDEDGKLTEGGKERLLNTLFEIVSEDLYQKAMRGVQEAAKAKRDLKKVSKKTVKKATK